MEQAHVLSLDGNTVISTINITRVKVVPY